MQKYMPIMTTLEGEGVQKTEKNSSVTLHYPMLTKLNYSVGAIKMRVNLQAQGVCVGCNSKRRRG